MQQRPIKRLMIVFLAVVTALCAPSQGDAQSAKPKGVPQAFAMVQAPEAAVEACHGASAQAALDCALRRCQRKAGRGACYAVTACAPGGWAGIMGVKLKDVHFSDAICGAPSQPALVAALRAFCQGHGAGLEQCSLTQAWSPDGKPQKIDHTWTPADFRK